MKRSRWAARLASIVLVAATIGGVAVAVGSQGSQSNPLLTLDYLNEKGIPDILKQVDKKIDAKAEELSKDMEKGAKAAFAVVVVGAGKTVTLSSGTQLLFRSGIAACYDGMIDLTDGVMLSGALNLNHLYIATGDGQSVTTSSPSVFMIQGSYQTN